LRLPLVLAPTVEVSGDVAELEPRVLPNLRLGEEFVMVGKRSGNAPFNVTLRGRLNGAAYSLVRPVSVETTPSALPFAARLWAQSKIRELETSGDATASKQIADLSKQFRVMSRETSWLVLENEQMFAEFGIPRRAPAPDAAASGDSQPDRAALAQELDLQGVLGASNGAIASPEVGSGARAPSGSAAGPAADEAKRSSTTPSPAPPSAPSPATPASPPAKASPPPGSAGGGLSGIGSTGTGAGSGSGSGASSQVSGPQGNASVGGAAVSGGTVSNAARVVAGMRPGFRNCFQRALAQDPTLSGGTLRLTIKIGPAGEVTNVTPSPGGSLPPNVVACVVSRARAAQFDAPSGGSATIVVPVTFSAQPGTTGPVLPQPPGGLGPRFFEPPPDIAVTRPGDENWQAQGQAALDKLSADLASGPTIRKRHEALVRGLLLRGRFAQALAAAERFVGLDPDSAVARELLAYAAVATGDRNRATAAVDAITESAPTELKGHARAARAFEALGDETRACAHWRSVFELAPTSDSALFEALRCRARVMSDREAALRDAKAVSRPGPLLQKLLPLLESSQVPAFEKSSGSAGQFEVTLNCEAKSDCPFAIVITPTGTVFSPWTPALGRSSPTSFAFSGLLSGVYHVLLIGGTPSATGSATVRALNTTQTLRFTSGHLPTIASTQVTLVPSGLGLRGGGLGVLSQF
jgi:Ca-activated chloride channel family protein